MAEKSYTPEDPYHGRFDKVFDAFTKKNTPAGADKTMDTTKRRKSIDDAVEKAGG